MFNITSLVSVFMVTLYYHRIYASMLLKRRVVAFITFGFLAYLFWGRSLSFTFWKDDWYYLWGAIYSPLSLFKISSLHPGTTGEFFLFAKLFGQNPVYWQHFGILLRAAAAVSIMEMTGMLTASEITGWVAGLIFVTMPLGLESIHWPSAHVANLVILLFCGGMSAYGRYVSNHKKSFVWPLLLFSAAILADPLRVLPLMWVPLAYTMKPIRELVRHRLHRFTGVLLVIISFIGVLLVTPFISPWFASRLDLIRMHSTRFGIILNYWNVLWNLLTGWAVPVPHTAAELSHSVFNRLSAIAGFVVFSVTIGVLFWYRKAWHTKQYRFIFIASMWCMTALGVQWVVDPRLIPATAHRYFVLPSVGVAMLFAWVIARFPRWFVVVILAFYLGVAWHRGTIVLGEMIPLRTPESVNSIWQTIDRAVTTKDISPIIFIKGEEPMKTNAVEIDANGHFMLIRANQGISQSALFTTDSAAIARLLCGSNTDIVRKYTLGDVYAFSIFESGTARDDTKSFRSNLLYDPAIRRCLGSNLL